MHKVASIISFCTNDVRFLKACIEGVKTFSHQVLISVSDHFFNGELENLALLEQIYKQFPDCTFIEFAFDPNELYGSCAYSRENPDWVHHWHNSARLVAYHFVKEEIDSLFFVDSDEIVESQKFAAWLQKGCTFNAVRFRTYYYFRETRFQATTWPDGLLFVKKSALDPDWLLDSDERMGLFFKMLGRKERFMLGLDGKPMIHHYSWVRTKEEMLKKVTCWGHHWERNWEERVEEEFSRPFNGTDFVRDYSYREVTPHFDLEPLTPQSKNISLEEHIKNIKSLSNVIRVTAKEIFRKDLLLRITK